nr:glycosyltransferase family 25 protein [Parabacteroides goldsteinii]
MKIKTYVINLKESVDRREKVWAETQKYPCLDVEWVEAVNGRTLSSEDVRKRFNVMEFIYKYVRTPNRGEIGCTLSHRECCRRLLESEEEYALILEDDVVFLDQERVEDMLEKITSLLKRTTPHLITLSTHLIYYKNKKLQIDNYSIYKLWMVWGTCAYLINRKAAGKLLSVSRPFIVADDFTYMQRKGILVEGIYPTFAAGASSMENIQTEIQNGDTDLIYRSDIPFQHRLKYYWVRLCCKLLLYVNVLSIRRYLKGRNE